MATSTSRAAVLLGYRTLLKTSIKVFGKDVVARTAAAAQLKQEFRANMFETDPEKISNMITGIQEANDTLLEMVVQASFQEETNSYG